jgi:hypothetical protein
MPKSESRKSGKDGTLFVIFSRVEDLAELVAVKCADLAALRGKPWQFILTTEIISFLVPIHRP